jgi:hypothetical protein
MGIPMPENPEPLNDLFEPALDGGATCQEIPQEHADDKSQDEAVVHGKCTSCGGTLCGVGGWKRKKGRLTKGALMGTDTEVTCQGCLDQLAREGTRDDFYGPDRSYA